MDNGLAAQHVTRVQVVADIDNRRYCAFDLSYILQSLLHRWHHYV